MNSVGQSEGERLRPDRSSNLQTNGALPETKTGAGLSLREAELSEAISTRPGRLLRVSVVRAGTTPGAVHDAETLAGAVASSRIATIPRTIAMYDVEWPCDFGIVVLPGAGQVLAVVFV